jgi:hypothetical protein
MRKPFLISVILSCFSNLAFSQVSISIDCQDSWGPGRYNQVTVKIDFGKADGFARFTQDFPVGFYVIKDKIDDGDFSWNDNQLNVVWIRMPEKNPVSFSYYIIPDQSMNGNIEINGKAVIISGGNEKQTYLMAEKPVTIEGLNGILPSEMKSETGNQIVTNVTKNATVTSKVKSAGNNGIIYRVQVSVSSSKITGDELKKKLGIEKGELVTIVTTGNIYKYQVGNCLDINCAKEVLKRMAAKGVKDPFIVAYKGETQVPFEKTP